jgi:tRNA nucleotidyltransferase (CCA-adding enzyme)
MTAQAVVAQLMNLPAPALALLQQGAAIALRQGAAPYLVGGSVRDLLLGRTTIDLDIVVTGDALAVAADLQATTGGELHTHDAFGTAKLVTPMGQSLDLITARDEHYPVPGALPVVAPGTLADDLRRRDFTINAIAAALEPGRFGAIVDPCEGRADLAAGLIRALHPASFTDDPTRLLRGIRYACRLTAATQPFTFERQTAAWFDAAVAAGALATVSIDRQVHEFARLLAEPAASAMLDCLAESGLLTQLDDRLRWDVTVRAASATLDQLWPLAGAAVSGRWMARFVLLIAHLPREAALAVVADLHLPAAVARLTREVCTVRERGAALTTPLAASVLGGLLDGFSAVALITAAALADEGGRTRIVDYLTTVRATRPRLTGEALRALGVPPGPVYREALAALLAAVRDNPGRSEADERAMLRDWLRERGIALTP